MNVLNQMFIQDFCTPTGVINGAMLYKVEIDPQDANGEDNVFAQILIRPDHVDIIIKQLFEAVDASPIYYRHNHVKISHDVNIGEAIQSATLEGLLHND